MLIDLRSMIRDVFSDLDAVASSDPNERLPKEEQIRCSIYAALKPQHHVVCAERGYRSVDARGRAECDIWVGSLSKLSAWMELKSCRCASGWVNKPSEELTRWKEDIDKLRRAPQDAERYFLLFGFLDFDALNTPLPRRGQVLRNIDSFHPEHLAYRECRPFSWRKRDGITHVSAWAWLWRSGQVID